MFIVLELCDIARDAGLEFVESAILGSPSPLPEW
jgi:hypothetical protein